MVFNKILTVESFRNKMNMLHSTPIKIVLIAMVVFSTSACKKNKKLAELSAPQKTENEVEVVSVDEEEAEDVKEEPVMEDPIPTRVKPELSTTEQLDSFFREIAEASTLELANRNIEEALSLFISPDAPLLIVFYEANGKASYDAPTTIKKYLEYLKDTKNPSATVDEIAKDSNGKIKEIILKK